MTQARRSLLAEMALRFVDQRETLATAGLGYILSGSATARTALRVFLAERGVRLPDDLAYRAEVVDREHEGRPDIVGMRGERWHLILEGKFWAALTDAQPVSTYAASTRTAVCWLSRLSGGCRSSRRSSCAGVSALIWSWRNRPP